MSRNAQRSNNRSHELLHVAADGRVARMSPSAREWLEEFVTPLVNGGHHLPTELDYWLRRQRRLIERWPSTPPAPWIGLRPDGRLTVRLAEANPQQTTLLLVRERTGNGGAPRPELTPRESEVLHWIAEGKSNPEIAIILELSRRTVHKHVQHILKKIRVESRGAAMVWVWGLGSAGK